MGPSALGIHRERDGTRNTLVLTGELDIASAAALEAAAREICAEGASELVLDLGELEFIDSAGLNSILRVRALCQEQMCEFCLTPGERPVQHVFEITRLIDRLPFRRSRHLRREAPRAEEPPLPAAGSEPETQA